jgi:hypothetical protein
VTAMQYIFFPPASNIFPVLHETCLWHSPDHKNVAAMMHHTSCLNVTPLQIPLSCFKPGTFI